MRHLALVASPSMATLMISPNKYLICYFPACASVSLPVLILASPVWGYKKTVARVCGLLTLVEEGFCRGVCGVTELVTG